MCIIFSILELLTIRLVYRLTSGHIDDLWEIVYRELVEENIFNTFKIKCKYPNNTNTHDRFSPSQDANSCSRASSKLEEFQPTMVGLFVNNFKIFGARSSAERGKRNRSKNPDHLCRQMIGKLRCFLSAH